MAAILENDRTLGTRFVTAEFQDFALLSNLLVFPNSYKNFHFQNEGKCKIFPNFICMRIWNIFQTSTFTLSLAWTLSIGATLKLPIQFVFSVLLFIFFFIFHLYFDMYVNPKIIIERDFLKDAKINSQREKSVLYNYTNQFQQYYDNDNDDDNDNDNDNDNVDNNDDNDNKQNKSKIAAPKNIKLPPTFRATR